MRIISQVQLEWSVQRTTKIFSHKTTIMKLFVVTALPAELFRIKWEIINYIGKVISENFKQKVIIAIREFAPTSIEISFLIF